MIVARQAVTEKSPEAMGEFYRLLVESKKMALPAPSGRDPTPMGLEANRRNVALTIDCAYRQGLITRRFEVDELFNPVTAGLR